jgi:CDP-diacylglycerol--serine O-phosphatidyltransferase
VKAPFLQLVRDAFADEADGLGRITRAVTLADLFTLANAVVGLWGVYLAATGDIANAARLVALSVVLDGTDGIAARLYGGGPLGPFLDTLADLLSFGILPAAIIAVGVAGFGPWAFVVAALFLVCAMLRLARFEVLREDSPLRYYNGMTTTGAAVLIAAMVLADMPDLAVLLGAVVLALWMISRVRTVKLTFWPLVAGAFTLFPTFLDGVLDMPRDYVVASLVVGMFVYTFVGPFYILARYGPTPHPSQRVQDAEAPR